MTEPKFNFSHLNVSQKVSRHTFYQVPGEPYLDVTHAGEANKPYFNALLKRSRNNVRRMRAGGIDAAAMTQNRNEDREIYHKHIVKGWGCKDGPGFILDSEGNRIDYSQGNVATFLNALPNWVFDELRVFAGEESNFIDEMSDGEAIPDAEAVSGN